MKKNAYFCEDLHITITQEPDDNADDRKTTAFVIECPFCGKRAISIMYRVNQESQKLVPTHEFYKPEAKHMDLLSEQEIEHVKRGGLLFRKIPP